MTDDYESRAKQFGFAEKDAIQEALADTGTVILDVRTTEEIAADGRVSSVDHPAWVQTSDCTPDGCPSLETSPETLLPNKSANIIVHCKSGRRK
jgi:rhodanese-related sulfurtransferase